MAARLGIVDTWSAREFRKRIEECCGWQSSWLRQSWPLPRSGVCVDGQNPAIEGLLDKPTPQANDFQPTGSYKCHPSES